MVKKLSKAEKARKRQADALGNQASESTRGQGKGRGKRGGVTASGLRLGRSLMLPPDQLALLNSRKQTVQMEESAFSKLSPPVLETLGMLASYCKLSRPIINPELTTFDFQRFGRTRNEHTIRKLQHDDNDRQTRVAHPLSEWLTSSLKQDQNEQDNPDTDATSTPTIIVQDGPEQLGELRLPKRPKWRTDMDAKALHSNEESVFQTWLKQTDQTVEHAFFSSSPLFQHIPSPNQTNSHTQSVEGTSDARTKTVLPQLSSEVILSNRPQPGTAVIGSLYERNLEVYRQLWRVCERSDLVCVLADSRCPALHLPPSLTAFLERFMRLKVVIVLTKADMVPAPIVEAWKKWLQDRFPDWEIVGTESYAKLERMEGQGGRARFVPYLSPNSRSDLFKALRKAHKDLITPPAPIRDDPEKLKHWNPPCATEVDWEGVERRVQQQTFGEVDQPNPLPETQARNSTAKDMDDQEQQGRDPTRRQPLPFVTVGLIGQPNVGKSSLLNAMFGAKVVRASKTPGKTKHFQTHFLTPLSSSGDKKHRGQIRLCDSPGLVFPSLIGMEMQVMGAILPISQVQATTSCVRFVGEHLPLEKVLNLDYRKDQDDQNASVIRKAEADKNSESWTAVQILEAVARRYQFKTAKANRWDVNRAGNLVMRAIAEGRIKWAFLPPVQSVEDPYLDAIRKQGDGIWIKEADEGEDVLVQQQDPDEEEERQAEDADKKVRFEEESSSDEIEEDENDDEAVPTASGGGSLSLFSALAVEGGEEEEEEE